MGADEETSWTFYLNFDPNFVDFRSGSGPLTSALLTLTLTPKPGVETEVVLIESLSLINAPEIQSLPIDVTKCNVPEI